MHCRCPLHASKGLGAGILCSLLHVGEAKKETLAHAHISFAQRHNQDPLDVQFPQVSSLLKGDSKRTILANPKTSAWCVMLRSGLPRSLPDYMWS